MNKHFMCIMLGLFGGVIAASYKPNIILIVSDDLGWSDVGFTNKALRDNNADYVDVPETPVLDSLANGGIILDNLYTQAICTPTRASLLTGKYAYRLGLMFAAFVSLKGEDALSTEHTLISEVVATV